MKFEMEFELVKVVDRWHLLNAVQLRCAYTTRDRVPLPRGIHVVFRRAGAAVRIYDHSVDFYGPFPSWRTAHQFAAECLAAYEEDLMKRHTTLRGEFACS